MEVQAKRTFFRYQSLVIAFIFLALIRSAQLTEAEILDYKTSSHHEKFKQTGKIKEMSYLN